MKKNGFTLAELLITLGLIIIVGLIIANNIVALTNRQSDNEYNDFKGRIEKAACIYAGLDKNAVDCANKNCVVVVKDLIAEGLLDDELYNPKTESEVDIDSTVFVQNDNGKKTCYYSEDNSTYDFIGPSVSINKQYGLVEISISDTNYLGKYEINTSPTNMHNATSFGLQKKTETLYYEPKTPGKYYLHVTDQFNNLSVVSSANNNHPSFEIKDSDIDTTPPVITIDSISRGVIKATIYDDVKVKGYVLTTSSNDPSVDDYHLLYNKQLTLNDMAVGGEAKTVTLDPIMETGTFYLHAIDYYNNKTNYKLTVDFNKPTISYETNGSNVAITFKDDYGLQKYFITRLATLPNDAEWVSLSDKVKEITINETLTNPGNYYVYLYDVQDNLVVENIYVDLTAPNVTIDINNLTVSYKITDDGTLVKYRIYKSGSSAPYIDIEGKEYSGTYTGTGPGSYFFEVHDQNGNVLNRGFELY